MDRSNTAAQLDDRFALSPERREFLQQCMTVAGGTVFAYVVVSAAPTEAAAVAEDDARLDIERVSYPVAQGEIDAYLVRPRGDEPLPGVVVIHEIFGLNAHIEDVARRLALEGFVVMAPDALTPVGGTPPTDAEAMSKIRELDQAATADNLAAAVEYLRTSPQTNGKVGVTGFSWGGGMANQVAVRSAELKAAVPYYGRVPDTEDVPKIKAPLMCHYAGDDERINAGIPGFEEALKKAGIEYQIYVYEGAQHQFNNDTSPRYHHGAAALAWQRTVGFFKQKL